MLPGIALGDFIILLYPYSSTIKYESAQMFPQIGCYFNEIPIAIWKLTKKMVEMKIQAFSNI